MTHWYYADAQGLQQGPIDADTLRARHAEGAIAPASLVWREGMAAWQPLSAVADELDLAMPAAAGTLGMAAPVPATVTDPAGDVVYAGFWRRLAANFIDSFIIGIAALPITLPAGIAMGALGNHGDTEAWAQILVFQLVIQLVALVVTVVYFSCFHASRLMASPGKLAVGIKVVRTDGSRLGFGRAVGRGFAYYLSFLTLYVGFVMAAFTRRKQGLHDLICDTLVVDRWAFTDTPGRQCRGLDTVTVVVLILYGLLMLAVLVLLGIALVAGLAAAAH